MQVLTIVCQTGRLLGTPLPLGGRCGEVSTSLQDRESPGYSAEYMGFSPGCPSSPAVLRHPASPADKEQETQQRLLRSGDVETNPGPNCPHCTKKKTSKDYSINMSVAEIRSWTTWRWHCGGCTPAPAPPAQQQKKKKPTTQNECILQINVDGWRGKQTVLNKLLNEFNPEAVVLQEKKIKNESEASKVRNYTAITAERSVRRTDAQERAQGGLAILVRNNVTIKKVLGKLNTPPGAALETLGVRVAWAKGDVDLWNIYRPPARDHRDADLHLDNWPTGEQVIILSDANCHWSWD